MHQLLNTLYVTKRAYLHLDHDTVRAEIDGEKVLQAPLLPLGAIVCFGDVLVSPALIRRCSEDGRSIVFLTSSGRFAARVEGPVNGNVLLRRAQHLALSEPERRVELARTLIAGKLRNARFVLQRALRDNPREEDGDLLRWASEVHATALARLPSRTSVDLLQGDEGEAARAYFEAMPALIRQQRDVFTMTSRNRRPPLDPMNALLSFLYTLLRGECASALEGVGLDPQIGYLHALRPGRPALALDLMEELRPVLADRLALNLINRQQLSAADFEHFDGGAVYLNESGRKLVIRAWQERKQEEVTHRVIGGKTPVGLIPHLQARLLARTLRKDLAHYPPFLAH